MFASLMFAILGLTCDALWSLSFTYRKEGLNLGLLKEMLAGYEHPTSNELDDTTLLGNEILITQILVVLLPVHEALGYW